MELWREHFTSLSRSTLTTPSCQRKSILPENRAQYSQTNRSAPSISVIPKQLPITSRMIPTGLEIERHFFFLLVLSRFFSLVCWQDLTESSSYCLACPGNTNCWHRGSGCGAEGQYINGGHFNLSTKKNSGTVAQIHLNLPWTSAQNKKLLFLWNICFEWQILSMLLPWGVSLHSPRTARQLTLTSSLTSAAG